MPEIAKDSLFFYTFHKCASTLFASYVLKNLQGLTNIDYARKIYDGEHVDNVVFNDAGFVYGPIRLSASPETPVYTRYVAHVSRKDFVRDRLAIFFIRDPRDILVSSYYSFGFTHGFSAVPEIREQQAKARDRIQSLTLDEFAIWKAAKIKAHFGKLNELRLACQRGILLKYEDLVDDFDSFMQQFTQVVEIAPHVTHEIFARSRPKAVESPEAHQRSGKVAGFRNKLQADTIEILNQELADVLTTFRYDA